MIILSILKVIGIVLLAIIGLFVLLLLLVLFVPLKYSVSGHRDSEVPVFVNARVSWLFKLIRVSFIYSDKRHLKAKLLFFTVYNSDKPKKAKRRKERKKDKREKEKREKGKPEAASAEDFTFSPDEAALNAGEAKEPTEAKETAEATEPTEATEATEPTEATEAKETAETKAKRPALSLPGKIKQFFENIAYTIRKFYARIIDTRQKASDITAKVTDYIEKLKSDEVKEAISLCLGQLRKIWKSIRPKKIRVHIVVGMDDPAATGKILEFYSILYPYIGKNVYMRADFERPAIEGDFIVRGQAASYGMLWAGFKIYRDKNIRKVIKMFTI